MSPCYWLYLCFALSFKVFHRKVRVDPLLNSKRDIFQSPKCHCLKSEHNQDYWDCVSRHCSGVFRFESHPLMEKPVSAKLGQMRLFISQLPPGVEPGGRWELSLMEKTAWLPMLGWKKDGLLSIPLCFCGQTFSPGRHVSRSNYVSTSNRDPTPALLSLFNTVLFPDQYSHISMLMTLLFKTLSDICPLPTNKGTLFYLGI